MNFTSITAISRDGGNAIFTKYIPIPLYKQITYKVLPGIIFNTISTLSILCVLYYFLPQLSILSKIIIFLMLMTVNILENYLLFIVDLKRPKLNWSTEYAVVKQNMNMLYEFALAIAVAIAIIAIGGVLNQYSYIIVMTGIEIILIVITILLYRYIKSDDMELFKKIQ